MDAVEQGPKFPHFFPLSFDSAELPEPIKAALKDIVEPVYEDLVTQAPSSLMKATGVSIAHLLCEEVLAQFQLGQSLQFLQDDSAEMREARQKELDRLLRLVNVKNRHVSLHLQLRVARQKYGDPTGPTVCVHEDTH